MRNEAKFELATLLKPREVPFVFLTGSRREEIPDEFRDAPFIAKPYEPIRLVEHIRKIIPDASECTLDQSKSRHLRGYLHRRNLSGLHGLRSARAPPLGRGTPRRQPIEFGNDLL